MKTQRFFLTITPLVLAITLSGCGAVAAPVGSILPTVLNPARTPAQVATAQPAASTSINKNEALTAIEDTLNEIYAQVNPSVVSIQVTQKTSGAGLSQLPALPFFFGQPQTAPGQQPQGQQEFYQHGAGSGFVWDKEGHIITNNHVVADADKITVTLADKTVVPAEVVGTDPDSDLAVLKVDLPADQLHPVTLGDSTQLKIGHLTVAIGNPFGLENTMTVGFISALGRILPANSSPDQALPGQGTSYTIPDIIQTDAPINPGNSGGVLVDDQGQVIGVTAAIESPVRASAGVGFAIPAAIVQKVVPALITDGHFEHPWLGLSGVTLYPELAQAMNLKADQHGALVVEVLPNSPADEAGLHGSDRQIKIEDQEVRLGGDVVVAIDGKPVTTMDDLVEYLAQSTEVNQTISLTVLRQGQPQTIKIALAARPKPAIEAPQPEAAVGNGPQLGVEGITVTPDIAASMNLPDTQQGVLVGRIMTGSPADTAQLHGSYKSMRINGQLVPVGGDIITAVDGQPVKTIQELQGAVRNAKPGQTVTLSVLRDGKQVDVPVTFNTGS